MREQIFDAWFVRVVPLVPAAYCVPFPPSTAIHPEVDSPVFTSSRIHVVDV
jgi:hypothetical protein